MMPPLYCITLRRTPERRALAQTEFNRHGLSATFVYGIDGKGWGLHSLHPYMEDRKPEDGPFYPGPGVYGLLLSFHFVLLLAELAGHKEFIVFEDDVTLTDNFAAEFLAVRHDLPDDWQIVYLGSGGSEQRRCIPVKRRIWRMDNPLCTHALLIRQSAVAQLLEAQAYLWAPLDIQIAVRSLPRLRHYTILPVLATQKSLDAAWQGRIEKTIG